MKYSRGLFIGHGEHPHFLHSSTHINDDLSLDKSAGVATKVNTYTHTYISCCYYINAGNSFSVMIDT